MMKSMSSLRTRSYPRTELISLRLDMKPNFFSYVELGPKSSISRLTERVSFFFMFECDRR